MILESPRFRQSEGADSAYGLTDPETGAGVMLNSKAGGLFSVDITEADLHSLTQAKLFIGVQRYHRNKFRLIICPATPDVYHDRIP